MSDAPSGRTCKKCGETKPLAAFERSKLCKWGRTHTCTHCRRHNRKPRADEGSPPVERTCRDCGLTKPLQAFKPSVSCHWGYSHKCRDCAAAQVIAWRDAGNRARRNPDREREYAEQTALAKAAVECERSAVNRRGATARDLVVPLVVLERDDGVCGICGEDVDPFDFELDHIVSCRDGGDHSYENVQLAHRGCNVRKFNQHERKAAAA